MTEPYIILFQKSGENHPVMNSYQDFGCVCLDFPFLLDGGTKKLSSRDWAEEDGEDVYIPNRIPLSAYDLEAKMCYIGDERRLASGSIAGFRDYLRGKDNDGADLKVWNSHTSIGRRRVYFQGMSEPSFYKDSEGKEVLTFSVKFRVTDPVTDVRPFIEDDGTVSGLIEMEQQ